MTDVYTEEKRSAIMSRIRAKNTKPEVFVRKLLFARGFRFRIHRKDLPDKVRGGVVGSDVGLHPGGDGARGRDRARGCGRARGLREGADAPAPAPAPAPGPVPSSLRASTHGVHPPAATFAVASDSFASFASKAADVYSTYPKGCSDGKASRITRSPCLQTASTLPSSLLAVRTGLP